MTEKNIIRKLAQPYFEEILVSKKREIYDAPYDAMLILRVSEQK